MTHIAISASPSTGQATKYLATVARLSPGEIVVVALRADPVGPAVVVAVVVLAAVAVVAEVALLIEATAAGTVLALLPVVGAVLVIVVAGQALDLVLVAAPTAASVHTAASTAVALSVRRRSQYRAFRVRRDAHLDATSVEIVF